MRQVQQQAQQARPTQQRASRRPLATATALPTMAGVRRAGGSTAKLSAFGLHTAIVCIGRCGVIACHTHTRTCRITRLAHSTRPTLCKCSFLPCLAGGFDDDGDDDLGDGGFDGGWGDIGDVLEAVAEGGEGLEMVEVRAWVRCCVVVQAGKQGCVAGLLVAGLGWLSVAPH